MRSDLVLDLLTGLFLILLALLPRWRWHRSKTPPATSQPTQRKRAPNPFAGSTPRPVCALCEPDGASHPHRPGAPPPPLLFSRGRRRPIDTTGHGWPHTTCSYPGRGGWGHLRANGQPNGRRWRPRVGRSGPRHGLETPGTPVPGQPVAPAKLGGAMAALAAGRGIRAVARGLETAPATGWGGRVEAAEPLEACSRPCVHDLAGAQGQREERWAWRSAVKDGEGSEPRASKRLSRAPPGVWGALAPGGQLILAVDVGDRTLAMAQRLGPQGPRGLAPPCAPRVRPDGLRASRTGLGTPDGRWLQPERRQAPGPPPQARWRPGPGLL